MEVYKADVSADEHMADGLRLTLDDMEEKIADLKAAVQTEKDACVRLPGVGSLGPSLLLTCGFLGGLDSLSIQMSWLKNYTGGDGDCASDMSGFETNSVARFLPFLTLLGRFEAQPPSIPSM